MQVKFSNLFIADAVNYRFIRTNATEGSLLKLEGEKPMYNQDDFIGVIVEKSTGPPIFFIPRYLYFVFIFAFSSHGTLAKLIAFT